MAKKYLERLTALMEQATSGGSRKVSLEYKHFFSGAAVYVNGQICMSLTPAGFAIKLPEKSRNDLIKRASAKPLRYFPKGPIKEEYIVLPRAVLNDASAFRRWVKASIEYVTSRPNRNSGIVIGKLRNLGRRSEEMLARAGIRTVNQLKAKGAAAAFVAVKRAGCRPSLNLLWAIEGGLMDRDWKDVAKSDRLHLLTQIELLEKGR